MPDKPQLSRMLGHWVSNALREHYLKVPCDFACACGKTWVPVSFEEGIEQWIEHVMEEMASA